MNWKKGDIAICIQQGGQNPYGNYPAVIKGKEYIVNDIYKCKCGEVSLDVGIYNPSGLPTKCGCTSYNHHDVSVHWACASRFIKKDPRSLEERIAEAVEKEEYELAHELKQQLA
jgi:hypothetical protein